MQSASRKDDNWIEHFHEHLEDVLNRRHELLYRPAGLIHWRVLKGRPSISIRYMVGLSYLGHAFGLSDEAAVVEWIENPYWQYFFGETYLQHQLLIDSSTMSRWRERIGGKGYELILTETPPGRKRQHRCREGVKLKRINVGHDHTVQGNPLAYRPPLLHCRRERLVRLSQKLGIKLRQSYARLGHWMLRKSSSYAHARQFKRAKKEVRTFRTHLGQVYRDILRKVLPDRDLHAEFYSEV